MAASPARSDQTRPALLSPGDHTPVQRPLRGPRHISGGLEHMLHLTPARPDERPQTPRTQADKWAANMAAVRQFHGREGRLKAEGGTRRTRHALVGRQPGGCVPCLAPGRGPDTARTYYRPVMQKWYIAV
ncbi:hypothetical protein SBRY_170015 [Actinacidiphila bryophytorum]|uniref:Uncharacterized protein n=1 Tax=Actinacidiphila bryophytorum TaxID=1436133 RepID=A0A9W4GYR1_9ACTN|nr:hypothetical protein SBRY_170015 [Actinacidiphila bryophytorum]